MSSAILYVAIVVIWACVLIPRWLRRDSAHDASQSADKSADKAAAGNVAPPDAGPAETQDMAEWRQADAAEDPPQQDEVSPPLTPDEARRRTLSARRRLLGMLVALEIAAISLALLELAAMWVVIPPSFMLAGYLLVLREAAHADAERAEREREAEARARARARERARVRRQAHAGERPVRHGAVAPPPAAAQYEDAGPGRDFAPGLAGKYTTSNAEIIDITARADDDYPQESTDNKLRAVGD